MIDSIADASHKSGVPVAALCHALAVPRSTYYRANEDKQKVSPVVRQKPKNALSNAEKDKVLALLHGDQFVDKTPCDVYNTLIDNGEYYCSPRTMYRMLKERGETTVRRRQRNHQNAVKPELIANRPNEVWTWDITKLKGPQKWQYYYLYVIMDIYSRYVVGWLIADRESQALASQLIQETALKQGIQPQQLTLHADRGASMTSHSVAQLLVFLGINKSHSRPYTSDDNPFSEAQFKTLKYHPDFPQRFMEMQNAESFCKKYFNLYNNEHYHSGIQWLTPKSAHTGEANIVLKNRYNTLTEAYLKNPIRFSNKAPRLKVLPDAVYINPPQTVEVNTGQRGGVMAG